MTRYFSGQPGNLGVVSAVAAASFPALCADLKVQTLPLTRAAYAALPKKEQDKAKRVSYLVPAAFGASPSARKYEFATTCNLLFLDVDDGTEAGRLLAQGWDLLGDLGYVVWHTATSTPAKPRLRLMVHAEAIPIVRYRQAVQSLAGLLGIADPTTESLVAVQVMYLPTIFADETASPVIASKPDGDPFIPTDITGEDAPEPGQDTVGDLDFLRSPMEDITLADASDALKHVDPDVAMAKWIEVAAGLKHQFGEAGYELWDKWSSGGKKYVDSDETAYRWGTLKANTPNRAPVTIRSVFKLAQDAGWKNEPLARRIRTDLVAWLGNSQRSSEELLDMGTKKIAKASPMLGALERKALMATLRGVLADRDLQVSLPDVRREIHRLEVEAQRQTGFPAWTKGLCFVTARNSFYRFATDRHFTPEVIDLLHGIDAEGDKTTRPRDYLIQTVGIPQVENLRYDPRQTKRFFADQGVPYVNTYRPTFAKPDPERAAEAGALFQQHLANLVTEARYQRTLSDFFAFLVQQPGVKIRWAPLLQSTKGAGKTFLAVALGAVLGRGNVAKLAGSDVLGRQYNDWAYGHQLVVMEEVRVVGHNRHDVMDKLKPCISDDEISLNEKFEKLRTVPNLTNYLMFTNHQDALAIQDDERRYFVLRSPLQRKAQVMALGGDAYFGPLFDMVRDNAGGLRAWFEAWTIDPSFDPEGRAPETPYLKEMADNASTPLAAAVRQVIEDEPHPLVRSDLLSSGALRSFVGELPGIGEFSDQLLGAVLRELGWVRVTQMQHEGARHTLWMTGSMADPVRVARERLECL